MRIQDYVRSVIRRFGFDLCSFDARFNFHARKEALFKQLSPDAVLDVGANEGQFALELRRGGYRGRILSFEPQRNAFRKLADQSREDSNWEVYPFGLGSDEALATIYNSQNSFSSSLFQPSSTNLEAHGDVAVQSTEEVKLRTADTVVEELGLSDKGLCMKVDTQGYELEVLGGASKTLEITSLLILEVSLEELYVGQPLFPEIDRAARAAGFYPALLSPADEDYAHFRVLQLDVWYLREGFRASTSR
ncbi:MAG: FkbM family methyltransferase [Opitutales bacterium]